MTNNNTNKQVQTIHNRIDALYQIEKLIGDCDLAILEASWKSNTTKLDEARQTRDRLYSLHIEHVNLVFNEIEDYRHSVPLNQFTRDNKIRLFREHLITMTLQDLNDITELYDEYAESLKQPENTAAKENSYDSLARIGGKELDFNITLNILLDAYEQDYGTKQLMEINGLKELKEKQQGKSANISQSQLRHTLKEAEADTDESAENISNHTTLGTKFSDNEANNEQVFTSIGLNR